MKKEIEQNVQEVLNVFERIKDFSYEDMKEFYEAIFDRLEDLDKYRIENKESLESKEFTKRLYARFNMSLSDEEVNGRVTEHITNNGSSQPIW